MFKSYFKKKIKQILKPLRKIITKFTLVDEKISKLETIMHPIDIGSNFIVSEEIEGDYLEFGVFKGESFIRAYNAITNYSNSWNTFERTNQAYSDINEAKKAFAKINNINRKFYAFDSFKGLPDLKPIDKSHPKFSKGRYDFSKQNFINELKKNKINMDKTEIIEGFYDTVLNNKLKKSINLNKAAMIMIDCDLYDSTKDVLNFITDLVHNGTIIIFDDWYVFKGNPKKGQQLACNEWLSKNPNIKLIDYKEYGPFQKSFIVNKNN